MDSGVTGALPVHASVGDRCNLQWKVQPQTAMPPKMAVKKLRATSLLAQRKDNVEKQINMSGNGLSEAKQRLHDMLTFSAIPGACRVTYELEIHDTGESATLRSYDMAGQLIGDDRPYEILKARFSPLRSRIDECLGIAGHAELVSGQKISTELDLQTKLLSLLLDGEPLL